MQKKRMTETLVCAREAEISFHIPYLHYGGRHSLVNVRGNTEFLRCSGLYFAVAVLHSQLHVGKTLDVMLLLSLVLITVAVQKN